MSEIERVEVKKKNSQIYACFPHTVQSLLALSSTQQSLIPPGLGIYTFGRSVRYNGRSYFNRFAECNKAQSWLNRKFLGKFECVHVFVCGVTNYVGLPKKWKELPFPAHFHESSSFFLMFSTNFGWLEITDLNVWFGNYAKLFVSTVYLRMAQRERARMCLCVCATEYHEIFGKFYLNISSWDLIRMHEHI